MDSLFSKMTKAFSGEQKSPIGKNIGEKAAERYARRKEQYGAVGWTKKLNSIFSPEENDVESENVISNIKKDKRKKGAKLSPKEKNPNTNPLYTKITNQSVYPLRKGDSLADIAAKLFNFIKINADVRAIHSIINNQFSEKSTLTTQLFADAAAAKTQVGNSRTPYKIEEEFHDKWITKLEKLGAKVIHY